jgi:GT2 family glycosyltransferase
MDERFFMYMEDVALCEEVRRRGGQVVWDRRAIVWHKGGHASRHYRARTYVQMRLAKIIYFTHYRGRTWGAVATVAFAVESFLKWLLATIFPRFGGAGAGPSLMLSTIRAGAWRDPRAAQYRLLAGGE